MMYIRINFKIKQTELHQGGGFVAQILN